MSKIHSYIKYSVLAGKNCALLFLNLKKYTQKMENLLTVPTEKNILVVCTNFLGFILLEYKFHLLYTFFHWCFCRVLDGT